MGEVGSPSQRAGRVWEAFQRDGRGRGPSRWAGRDWESLPDSREGSRGEALSEDWEEIGGHFREP